MMMRNDRPARAALGACVVLLLLHATRAHAQTATTATNDAANIDEMRRDSHIHLGPFYLKPGLLVKELGVDTNVYNTASDPTSDFTATLTPQSDVGIAIARRVLIRSTLGADLVYFANSVSERSIDPDVRVRAEAYAHRLTLFADAVYLNTRERPNFEIDVRSRHLENDFVGGLKLHLTAKLSAEVGAKRAESRYDADAFFNGASLQQTLNRTTSGFVGAVRDRITPLTTLGVKFDRLQDSFPYLPERNSHSFRVMPGVEFKPKALINGSAWFGYRQFTPDYPEDLPAFSGLVADIGLSYTLLGATTFGGAYHRDLTYSYEVEQPFFIDNSLGGSIRRALGGRFDTIVSVDRHKYEYRDLLTQEHPQVQRRIDTTWVYGANIGYRPNRSTRVGFGASYYTRDSNRVSFVQYDGLRFGATVTYGT